MYLNLLQLKISVEMMNAILKIDVKTSSAFANKSRVTKFSLKLMLNCGAEDSVFDLDLSHKGQNETEKYERGET